MTEDPTITGTEGVRTTDGSDPFTRRMTGYARHGNTPFDVPFISHIQGNLYVGGCEYGMVLPRRIMHMVSLYPWEEYTVKHELRSMAVVSAFDSEDIPEMFVHLAGWVRACIDDAPTLVHCQAGLNRSPLVAAIAMCKDSIMQPAGAIALLREKRSPAVLCNPYFEEWLLGGDRG